MIIGLGTDVISKHRIQKIIDSMEQPFAKKCLGEQEELAYEKMSDPQRLNFFAKRFCAKEAVAKAIGCGICKSLFLRDIEILNDWRGKPFVDINDRIENAISESSIFLSIINDCRISSKEGLSATKIHISISDEVEYVVATAIIECSVSKILANK